MALPGSTVALTELVTVTPEMVAPTVTEPAKPPVSDAVNTPEPCADAPEIEAMVPPTLLAVNAMLDAEGRPEGFRLPKASLVVRVAVMLEPEVTVLEDRVTTLFETE